MYRQQSQDNQSDLHHTPNSNGEGCVVSDVDICERRTDRSLVVNAGLPLWANIVRSSTDDILFPLSLSFSNSSSSSSKISIGKSDINIFSPVAALHDFDLRTFGATLSLLSHKFERSAKESDL
eukprot:CAMPEP_0185033172 /NCGR_PEP_ID=MMETSP1103-20130426/21925_1 /TAXON_ID=36769 /ORGANISM="Paraphysomonas bandaiensis, Strain Caron Lab Isolate" /LENGTH=122 /DNA_ID=CAMNT_0027569359 /DNA_START=124 /DNA_END=489 /DNA_ORIENTATION=-